LCHAAHVFAVTVSPVTIALVSRRPADGSNLIGVMRLPATGRVVPVRHCPAGEYRHKPEEHGQTSASVPLRGSTGPRMGQTRSLAVGDCSKVSCCWQIRLHGRGAQSLCAVVHGPRMSGAQMLGSPVRAGVGGVVAHPTRRAFAACYSTTHQGCTNPPGAPGELTPVALITDGLRPASSGGNATGREPAPPGWSCSRSRAGFTPGSLAACDQQG